VIPYADSNFFTRLYLPAPEESLANGLIEEAERQGAPPLPVTFLLRVEVFNAFELHVFTGKAAGQRWVTSELAAIAHASFREDLGNDGFVRLIDLPTEDLERAFIEISLRNSARFGFRTYDVLHVASALLLGCDTFWSFDAKAKKLASLEGLKVR
jgi:predicted nucleic acid-binding protein